MIKQIGLPLRSRPILLITRMITDRIELHSVLLPLLIIIIIIIIIIIVVVVVVVVVGDDTYYWVYLSSRVREWG